MKKTTHAILLCCGVAFFAFSAQARSPKLTDPEIAHVAVTANKIDIGYAEIAKKKTTNKDVLDFANMMATDHKSVIDQAVALVTKLHVTPKDNAMSKKLQADADKTKKNHWKANQAKLLKKLISTTK